MNPLIAETIGYVGGLCTAFCFMPQTLKTIRTKDVQSLSLVSYILYCIGILSWVLYGFYVHSVQMVVFNSISLFFAGYILIMIIKYKGKSREMEFKNDLFHKLQMAGCDCDAGNDYFNIPINYK